MRSNTLQPLLTKISNEVNIRRIDRRPEQISITCLVRFDGINDMENFSKGFDENFPEVALLLLMTLRSLTNNTIFFSSENNSSIQKKKRQRKREAKI